MSRSWQRGKESERLLHAHGQGIGRYRPRGFILSGACTGLSTALQLSNDSIALG
jgi:hypothetical protein